MEKGTATHSSTLARESQDLYTPRVPVDSTVNKTDPLTHFTTNDWMRKSCLLFNEIGKIFCKCPYLKQNEQFLISFHLICTLLRQNALFSSTSYQQRRKPRARPSVYRGCLPWVFQPLSLNDSHFQVNINIVENWFVQFLSVAHQ